MTIAFVGIDGTGKTTLLSMFAQYLEKRGKSVEIIKALQSDSNFMKNYNKVREEFLVRYPEKTHELNVIGSIIMSFDLFQQSEAIKSADSDNKVVILDRWAICQQLYAKVWLADNNFERLVYDMCFDPDLIFVIDTNLDLVEERLRKRGGANEFENILCLRRLKKLYYKYALSKKNTILINNNEEIEKAYEEIIKRYEDWISISSS